MRRAKSGMFARTSRLSARRLACAASTAPSSPTLHDDGRDVVLAAALVRELDERLDARVAFERERRVQLVGRLEVAVRPSLARTSVSPGDELDDERVDLDALVDADRARDRVLLLDLLDLLAGQLPALDELIEDRVVLGHLLDVAAAREVDAAVADVGDEPLVAERRGGRSASCPCRACSGRCCASSWIFEQARCTACSRSATMSFVVTLLRAGRPRRRSRRAAPSRA